MPQDAASEFGGAAVVRFLPRSQTWPRGGCTVSNPGGAGRLRTLCGLYSVLPPGPGALARREAILVLDDVPLMRRQESGCPTCLQVLQVGCGSPERARVFAEAIGRISVEDVLSGKEDWAAALLPIVSLLPRGDYRLTLDDYFPTDGAGRFFWTAFPRLAECEALSHCVAVHPRPAFLAPTQPPRVFRRDALARAEQSFPTRPGLALHLSNWGSALLDGHHRASCAARRGAALPCITIAPLLNDANDWFTEANQSAIDRLVAEVESVTIGELPSDVVPTDVASNYPDIDTLTGIEILARNRQRITDEEIDEIVSRRRPPHPPHDIYGNPIPLLLHTLAGMHDERAVPTAIRIARDFSLRSWWEQAFQFLARRPSEVVDDFFVEYLCARDIPERPELVQIINDYFRRQLPSEATGSRVP